MPGVRHLIYFGISFADPLWGELQTSLKTHAAEETSGLPSQSEGIGGIHKFFSKPKRLRRLGFCFADLP